MIYMKRLVSSGGVCYRCGCPDKWKLVDIQTESDIWETCTYECQAIEDNGNKCGMERSITTTMEDICTH